MAPKGSSVKDLVPSLVVLRVTEPLTGETIGGNSPTGEGGILAPSTVSLCLLPPGRGTYSFIFYVIHCGVLIGQETRLI